MSRTEARKLAEQIGAPVKTPDALRRWCRANGFTVALETPSGDWVILRGGSVAARCA